MVKPSLHLLGKNHVGMKSQLDSKWKASVLTSKPHTVLRSFCNLTVRHSLVFHLILLTLDTKRAAKPWSLCSSFIPFQECIHINATQETEPTQACSSWRASTGPGSSMVFQKKFMMSINSPSRYLWLEGNNSSFENSVFNLVPSYWLLHQKPWNFGMESWRGSK